MGSGVFARIEVRQGDITRLPVEVIVNAANPELEPGGGVCGAIHAAAGPGLADFCRSVGGCPPGEARLTPGFALPAAHVIHAVGPVWRGGEDGEPDLLAACYRAALDLARDHRVGSMAFPCISTGVYGYPPAKAAQVAVAAVVAFLEAHDLPQRVVFCTFSNDDTEILRDAVAHAAG
jgi:O-acetyl-ADP-ribose deacetylase (regulator of RNase III)